MAVTRDDVARHAGVSTAVVSYVLNDGPRPVSEASRQKVLAAIEHLGYRRDGAARTLAAGRSNSLGLVVPDISLPYFGGVTQDIAREAARRGHQVVVATTNWDLPTEHRSLRQLSEHRVDAVILMSVDPLQDEKDLTRWGLPLALVDRPVVTIEGAEAITRHLIEHGHRRIGLIGGPAGPRASERREQGWTRALTQAGIRPARSRVAHTPATERGGYEAVDRLLAAPASCTAIFTDSDVQAVGALRRLHELGVRVPDDVALATADSTPLAEFSVPTLTALTQPHDHLGRMAVEAVLADGASGVLHVETAEFAVAARESCGPHPV